MMEVVEFLGRSLICVMCVAIIVCILGMLTLGIKAWYEEITGG